MLSKKKHLQPSVARSFKFTDCRCLSRTGSADDKVGSMHVRTISWREFFFNIVAPLKSSSSTLPLLCSFSDAGMTRLSTRCGARRPKSAKARNRGKWGADGCRGRYGDLAAVPDLSAA